MNLSKSKIISSFIAIAIVLSTTAVYAKAPQLGSGLVKEQQNLATKQAWQQYKAAITSKKDTIKTNEQTNKGLRVTLAQKRTTIKGLIQGIEKSKKQLPSSDLTNIQAELQTINTDIALLQTLNGSIKTDYQTIKTDITSKNYQDAEAQFDKIISGQNSKTTDLTNLNTEADKLISLLQTAAANAVAQTTTPTAPSVTQ